MAISGALVHQGGSGTTVFRALGRQVGHEMVVSEALGRQVGSGTAVSGALGRLERPQGRHGVQKRAPQSARMDAAGTKIDAKWSLDAEKTNFVTQLSRESVLVCFSTDFWHFCEVSKASEVPRLSAKTEVRPFALWVALEPRTTLKVRRFQ